MNGEVENPDPRDAKPDWAQENPDEAAVVEMAALSLLPAYAWVHDGFPWFVPIVAVYFAFTWGSRLARLRARGWRRRR